MPSPSKWSARGSDCKSFEDFASLKQDLLGISEKLSGIIEEQLAAKVAAASLAGAVGALLVSAKASTQSGHSTGREDIFKPSIGQTGAGSNEVEIRKNGSQGSELFSNTSLHSESKVVKLPSDMGPAISSRKGTIIGDIPRTEEAETCFLGTLFRYCEGYEGEKERLERAKQDKCGYAKLLLSRVQLDPVLDSIMACIICINTVFIGLSMDRDDGSGQWIVYDALFFFAFLVELAIKIYAHGLRNIFLGPSRVGNCIDAVIVAIDALSLIMRLSGVDAAAFFRMLRLIKLVRVVRLMKSAMFRDLATMMQGIIGGMPTLGWSLVLFIIIVYVVSLLFREFFGRRFVDDVYSHFLTVPRAMFTTFRCSFGDCTSIRGIPIFEIVYEEYGALYSFLYCFFAFTVTIGLFNVISAIFVESTVHAAAALQHKKKKLRLQDHALWCTRIGALVRRLMNASPDHTVPDQLSDALDTICEVDVPKAVIDEMVKDPEAKAALLDLDIDPEDNEYLSDFLDPDNGGTIRVIELIEGLRRLRGDPRRSDIVTVDLMVRSIQQTVNDTYKLAISLQEAQLEIRERIIK